MSKLGGGIKNFQKIRYQLNFSLITVESFLYLFDSIHLYNQICHLLFCITTTPPPIRRDIVLQILWQFSLIRISNKLHIRFLRQ